MKRRMIALAVAVMAMGTVGRASAQSRDSGWWPWAGSSVQVGNGHSDKKAEKAAKKAQKEREQSTREDRDDDDRYPSSSQRRGNGPPFCRNGQGHPVKGMQWCEEKGWAPASWQSVVYRSRFSQSERIGQPTLRDILGAVILGRLTDHALQLGVRQPLEGRSFYAGDASVLQLRAGGLPIAELTDLNRDGRVDLVLLSSR